MHTCGVERSRWGMRTLGIRNRGKEPEQGEQMFSLGWSVKILGFAGQEANAVCIITPSATVTEVTIQQEHKPMSVAQTKTVRGVDLARGPYFLNP